MGISLANLELGTRTVIDFFDRCAADRYKPD
jgi:hypothetical protein